jgi:hypothetical protein
MQHPHHSTISKFRRRFGPEIEDLFLQVNIIGKEFGLIGLDAWYVDGTKIQANASIHHAYSYEKVQKLREQLAHEIDILKALSKGEENSDPALNIKDTDIPHEIDLREEKLSGMDRAINGIEERDKERYSAEMEAYEEKMYARGQVENETGKKLVGRVPKPPQEGPNPKDQYNLTDPESRVMPVGSKGYVQGYNAQACADPLAMLVLVAYITVNTNDKKEIKALLEILKSIYNSLGKVKALSADNGYFSEENVNACEDECIDPYFAPGRMPHHLQLKERFAPSEPLKLSTNMSCKDRMREKLKTDKGKEIYKKRKEVIEPTFGIIKETMKFRRFRLRGLQKVSLEWKLICIAYNIKMMFHKLSETQPEFFSNLCAKIS